MVGLREGLVLHQLTVPAARQLRGRMCPQMSHGQHHARSPRTQSALHTGARRAAVCTGNAGRGRRRCRGRARTAHPPRARAAGNVRISFFKVRVGSASQPLHRHVPIHYPIRHHMKGEGVPAWLPSQARIDWARSPRLAVRLSKYLRISIHMHAQIQSLSVPSMQAYDAAADSTGGARIEAETAVGGRTPCCIWA